MIELHSKVELYVPGTIRVSEKADTHEQVEKVATSFCQWFGGATVTVSDGYYLSSVGELIAEKTSIVWSYCTTELLEEYAPSVIALAEEVCQELQQETVAVVINGTMCFVPSE